MMMPQSVYLMKKWTSHSADFSDYLSTLSATRIQVIEEIVPKAIGWTSNGDPDKPPPPPLDRWHKGSGTSCGLLPQFVLDKLKVKLKGGTYAVQGLGVNARATPPTNRQRLEELMDQGIKVQGVWIDPDQGDIYDDIRPLPGDLYGVCYTGDATKTPQHVGVIVDPREDGWITADSGQGDSKLQVCNYCLRNFDWANRTLKQIKPTWEQGERELAGWVDIELLKM